MNPSRIAPRRPPPAPWGPFPLSELCVVLALVLLIIGITAWNREGLLLVACGGLLAGLAGAELALREHLARHRSHTVLLASAAAAVAFAMALSLKAQVAIAAGIAVAAYVLVALSLRGAYRRRTEPPGSGSTSGG